MGPCIVGVQLDVGAVAEVVADGTARRHGRVHEPTEPFELLEPL